MAWVIGTGVFYVYIRRHLISGYSFVIESVPVAP